MTDPRRTLRRTAASAVATVSLAVPLVGTAGAQAVLDPADPCPPGVDVTAAPFADRDGVATVHRLNVDCAYALEIVFGKATTPATYDPGGAVTRGQMASFIARSLDAAGYTLPDDGQQFSDVSPDDVHADNIRALRAIGVVIGYEDGTYRPGLPVGRDQMASYLIRAAEYAFDDPGGLSEGTSPFTDITPGNVHQGAIDGAYELFGLVLGRTPEIYDPASSTARDQMASFVVRLVDVILLSE